MRLLDLVDDIPRELLVNVPDVPRLQALENLGELRVLDVVVLKQLVDERVADAVEVLEGQQLVVLVGLHLVLLDQLYDLGAGEVLLGLLLLGDREEEGPLVLVDVLVRVEELKVIHIQEGEIFAQFVEVRDTGQDSLVVDDLDELVR